MNKKILIFVLLGLLFVPFTIGQFPNNADTISIWHMDEGSGIYFNDSVGGKNGTLYNNADWLTNGRFSSALYFGVTNSFAGIDPDFVFENNKGFTFDFWFNITSTQAGNYIFDIEDHTDRQPQINCVTSANGSFYCVTRTNSGVNVFIETNSTFDYSDGEWHRATLVRNVSSSRMLLYIDNVHQSNVSTDNNEISGFTYFNISGSMADPHYLNASIDEFRILNDSIIPQASDYASDNAPTIVISSPTNSTLTVNGTNITFTPSDDHAQGLNCWYKYDDNATTYLANVTESTSYSKEILDMTAGTHNISITCEDSAPQNTTEIVWFTVFEGQVVGFVKYLTPDFETNTTELILQVNTSASIVEDVNATLFYNNTGYGTTELSNTNHYNFTTSLIIPLVEINDTNLTFYWNYSVTYTNGTTHNYTTDEYNQSVLWSYYIINITSSDSNVIEYESVTFTTNINNLFSLGHINTNLTFNNTNQLSSNSTTTTFTTTMTTPEITVPNTTSVYNGTLTINYDGFTYTRNSSNYNLTIFQIIITNCTAGTVSTTPTLNFTLYDEDDPIARLRGDMAIKLDVWVDSDNKRSYAFNFSEDTSYQVCIYPTNRTITTDATIEYDNETAYATRNYYLVDQEINDGLTNTSLYLLSTSDSTNNQIVTIEVKDENNDVVSDVYTSIQKFYTGENLYRTVAMIKTDDVDGKGITFLRLNKVDYRFLLEKDGENIKTTEAQKITSTNPIIKVILGAILQIPEYLDKISGSCNRDEVRAGNTSTLSCTYNDESGLLQSGRLQVWKQGALRNVEFCDETSTESGDTITCTLDTTVNQTWHYSLTGEFGHGTHVFEKDIIQFFETSPFALSGLFIGFILIIMLAFVGVYNPSASIIMGMLGMIFMTAMNVISIEMGAIIGIVLAGSLVIFKMRT